jgi:glucose-6-phosphate isomerase
VSRLYGFNTTPRIVAGFFFFWYNFLMDKFQNSKFIFVVGIGGSDLASKAVWNAMTLHKPEVAKKIFFLESPDSREYEEVASFVKNETTNPEEVVLIAVSKSGKTAETLETFHKTFDILSEKFGAPINERVLIISSSETPLWNLAKEKGIEKIEWEGNIGGRFSAFTVAHSTVLAIAGLNSDAFVAGSKEVEDSQAVDLAKNIFDNYKKGTNILDFFIFNSELEDLGKWCRQLIAESLAVITPTVSIGPTDLHSMLELYLGGPKNRFTIFLKSLKEIDGSVNESAYENVVSAYEKAELPFEKYEIPEINERELGKFMALMMATTIELARLLGVDPYDQPAVEEYKKSVSL